MGCHSFFTPFGSFESDSGGRFPGGPVAETLSSDPMQGVRGSVSGRNSIPHAATECSHAATKRNLHSATKTQRSQIINQIKE